MWNTLVWQIDSWGRRGVVVAWLVLCGSDNLSFLLGCMFNESNAFSHILQRHGIDASRLLNAMVVVPWGRAWSGVHIKAYSCGIWYLSSTLLHFTDLRIRTEKGCKSHMVSASFPMHWQNKSMVLALVCRWASVEILFGNLFLKSTELLILSGWFPKSTEAQPMVPARFLNTCEHCMDSIATVLSIASNSKKDIARRFWLFQNTSATEPWASGSLGCSL
jgi:hypothetical protein